MFRSRHFFIAIVFLAFMTLISSNLFAYASTNQTNLSGPSNQLTASSNTNTTLSKDSSKLNIVASFYPILEFVKQVGGDEVRVTSLIPVGIEPHDFEPTIQQIQNAESAELVIYNGAGMEGPWIELLNANNTLDTSQGLNLTLTSDTHGLADGNVSMESEEESHEDAVVTNPHVWLDPILAKEQVAKIRDGLISVDPQNAEYYTNNSAEFLAELDSLDSEIRAALSNCNKEDFIAFHDAFTYFANRYGLNQHSIQGVSPEGEVVPQRIQEIVELARELGINVIYSEELADPRFVEVIAQEIPNGRVLILSPIEGIDAEEQAAGIDYLDKMRDNIANLKVGLQC